MTRGSIGAGSGAGGAGEGGGVGAAGAGGAGGEGGAGVEAEGVESTTVSLRSWVGSVPAGAGSSTGAVTGSATSIVVSCDSPNCGSKKSPMVAGMIHRILVVGLA